MKDKENMKNGSNTLVFYIFFIFKPIENYFISLLYSSIPSSFFIFMDLYPLNYLYSASTILDLTHSFYPLHICIILNSPNFFHLSI